MLAYLARYTHRVAISNRRLIAADGRGVTFTFKDYRIEGPGRYKEDDARDGRVHPLAGRTFQMRSLAFK